MYDVKSRLFPCLCGERVSARATAAEEAFMKATRKETEAKNASMSAEQLKRYGAFLSPRRCNAMPGYLLEVSDRHFQLQ